jgi:hypothetical protein
MFRSGYFDGSIPFLSQIALVASILLISIEFGVQQSWIALWEGSRAPFAPSFSYPKSIPLAFSTCATLCEGGCRRRFGEGCSLVSNCIDILAGFLVGRGGG